MKRRLSRKATKRLLLFVALVLLAAFLVPMGFPSERALKNTIADADRIVVRSGGLCHRRPEVEKVLFVVDDPNEIRSFVGKIQIRSLKGALRCSCCGNPTFEFYQSGDLIASVGFHHGRSIRWEGWRSDAYLTKQSSIDLVETLKSEGLTEAQIR